MRWTVFVRHPFRWQRKRADRPVLRCGFDGYYALRLPDLLQIGQTGLGCQIDRVVIVAAAVDDGGLEFDRVVRSDRITVAGVVGV